MGDMTKMGWLVKFEPEVAKAKILSAFALVKANRNALAAHFDVDRGTLHRWAKRLGLAKQLTAIEKKATKEGWRRDERRSGGNGPQKRAKQGASPGVRTAMKKKSQARSRKEV